MSSLLVIRGLLFDLEGTCIDMEWHHAEGFSRAANSYGMKITADEILRLPGYVGAGDARATGIILAHFGDRLDINTAQFIGRKMEFYNESICKTPPVLRPGFREFWIEASFPMAIASLTPRVQALQLIQATGLDALIPLSGMVFREDVEKIKPDPEVFQKAAARIGIDPHNVLVFGDSLYDMAAVKAAGAIAIGMPCNWTRDAVAGLVEHGAAHVFRDWRTVNLDGLIDTVQS